MDLGVDIGTSVEAGQLTTESACEVCARPFVSLRHGQATCGAAKCIKARSNRLERAKRGGQGPGVATCQQCGSSFTQKTRMNILCGSAECVRKRDRERHAMTPERIQRNRDRCAAWYAGKAKAKRSPWLLGAPIVPTHLPGGGLEVHIVGLSHAIEHRHASALHGLITACLNRGHERTDPVFTLMPWPSGCGWGLYVWTDEDAAKLAGREMPGRIFDREVTVRFSPLRKLRSPVVTKRGRRKLVIDTITPVTITSYGKKVLRSVPTGESLRGTLSDAWRKRLGVALPDGDVCIEVLGHNTELERLPLGKKLRLVPGWSGRVVVECNAVGEWLLRAASLVGMGGRLGYGFGRVRARVLQDGEDPCLGSTSAMGAWFVTPHAVARFAERAGGSALGRAEALAALIDESRRARFVRKLESGAELWVGSRPRRLRYVVGPGEGAKPALVTVLGRMRER